MDLQLNSIYSLDFVKKGLFAFSVVYSDVIPLRLKVTYLYEKNRLWLTFMMKISVTWVEAALL